MRVWDIHPGYLSNRSLLGQHVEIHAIFSIIYNNKQGYKNHPETIRWRNNLQELTRRHDITIAEMALRGYKHASPLPCSAKGRGDSRVLAYVDEPNEQFRILKQKYGDENIAGRLELPKRGSGFWAQHKYSVMARGYVYYKEIIVFIRNKADLPIEEEKELICEISEIMKMPVEEKALGNVINHVWGYFKKDASLEERKAYLNREPARYQELLDYFFELAQRKQEDYLLQSTLFADFTYEMEK